MNRKYTDIHATPRLLRSTRLLLGLAVFCCVAPRAQTIDDVGISGQVVLEDRYPERRVRFPNGVTSLADVVYAQPVGYRPLILDLYLPKTAGTDGKRYPLIVMIHGGGWISGHTRHSGAFSNWPEALAAIANEGYVVASVEYRLSGEAPFPAAFDDVRTAIRWLRSRADQYSVDRTRAVAMGGSAGGQLAALVGTACGTNRYPEPMTAAEPQESACVQGVVAWYGVFDFGDIVPVDGAEDGSQVAGAPGQYLDWGATSCDKEIVRAASPISFVDPADPPFLLIHGIDDPVVSVAQSRRMQSTLQAAGVEATLIEIPGVKHSFIGDTPEATINASRKAFDASVAFIRRVLGEE